LAETATIFQGWSVLFGWKIVFKLFYFSFVSVFLSIVRTVLRPKFGLCSGCDHEFSEKKVVYEDAIVNAIGVIFPRSKLTLLSWQRRLMNFRKSDHKSCFLADKSYGFVVMTNLAMAAQIYLH